MSLILSLLRDSLIVLSTIVLLFSCEMKRGYTYDVSDFRPELKKHLDEYVNKNELNFSDTIMRNFLKENCTKDELINLLECNVPIIRILSFRAIADRNDLDFFPLLLNHLDDTAKIVWWPVDDVRDATAISDLMIKKVARKINQDQKDKLVNEVLTKHVYLETADCMMNDIKPCERYYSIIKHRAQKELDKNQMYRNAIPLAKFKKQMDIPIIQKIFNGISEDSYYNECYFRVIEAFPDSSFFPVLVNYHERFKKKRYFEDNELVCYCKAVAQYRNQKSLEILTSLTKKDTYQDTLGFNIHKSIVFRAIHKYNSPLYHKLYDELKPQMKRYVIEDLDKPDYFERSDW